MPEQRCPTCGSDDPVVQWLRPDGSERAGRKHSRFTCPDPWHKGEQPELVPHGAGKDDYPDYGYQRPEQPRDESSLGMGEDTAGWLRSQSEQPQDDGTVTVCLTPRVYEELVARAEAAERVLAEREQRYADCFATLARVREFVEKRVNSRPVAGGAFAVQSFARQVLAILDPPQRDE